MSAAPRIRPARRRDLPALVGLLDQLFAQEAEFRPEPELQRRGLAMILADKRRGRILVLEEDGAVAAMVNLLESVSTALGGKVLTLEDVVVDKARRGRGLGSRLVAHALDWARAEGYLRVTLLTDRDNAGAIAFYRGLGFAESTMVPLRRVF